MLVCSELEVQGSRIVQEIGRISATSAWHGVHVNASGDHREAALARLIQQAKDFEADAIIGVDYAVDGARAIDLSAIPVQRIAASGIAVKLARG